MSDFNEKTEYIDRIEHRGTVEYVDQQKGILRIRLDGQHECGTCPAARLCSGAKSDVIDVECRNASLYKVGQRVVVEGTEQMHRKAIMLATVLPCVALIAGMVTVYLVTWNQLAAVLSGLGATILFYLLLYGMRNRVAHEFRFSVFPE